MDASSGVHAKVNALIKPQGTAFLSRKQFPAELLAIKWFYFGLY